MHSTLTQLKTNISIRKRHWLTLGLRIVNFRRNQVSLWQHSILEKPPFKFVQRRKKYRQFVSSCRLREIKMSDTCRLFPLFGDPWPSCLLPSHSDATRAPRPIVGAPCLGLEWAVSPGSLVPLLENEWSWNPRPGHHVLLASWTLSRDGKYTCMS